MSMCRKFNQTTKPFSGSAASVDLNSPGPSQSDEKTILFTTALFAKDNRSFKTTSEKPKKEKTKCLSTFRLGQFKATNFSLEKVSALFGGRDQQNDDWRSWLTRFREPRTQGTCQTFMMEMRPTVNENLL